MKYVILAYNDDDTVTNGCIENNVKLTIEASNKEEAIEEFKSLIKRSNYKILKTIKND